MRLWHNRTALTVSKACFMAASRSSTPALHIRSPHPRNALTIEEWEAKAPLGDVEIKSVATLKAACEQTPVFQPSAVRVSPPQPLHLDVTKKNAPPGFYRRSWSSCVITPSYSTHQTRSKLAPFHTARATSGACACTSPSAARANSATVLRLVRVDRPFCRPQPRSALSAAPVARIGTPRHV